MCLGKRLPWRLRPVYFQKFMFRGSRSQAHFLVHVPLLSSFVITSALTQSGCAQPAVEANSGQWQAAAQKSSVAGKLALGTELDLGVRLGEKRAAKILIQGGDGRQMELALQAQDASLLDTSTGKENYVQLADAVVNVVLKAPGEQPIFRDNYYIRPNPVSYKGEERKALLARWTQLPAASAHELRVKLEATGSGVGVWVDDRFVGQAPLAVPATVRVELAAGSALGDVRTQPLSPQRDRFVPIGLHGYRREDADTAVLPLKRGTTQAVGEVPFEVAAAGEVLDVGRSRWLGEKVGPEDMADTQYSRSSFDRRPDNILLAVPTDDYAFAHVLAAVDPDPAKTPVLTLSLSRFTNDGGDSGGRGDALADTSIRLEKQNGQWPAGVRQLGTVKARDAAGVEREMPLLQVAIPIKSGEIPDILDEKSFFWGRSTQYLDLELTKEMHLVRMLNYGSHSWKPLGKPSAAMVYGLTLEKAPVKVRVKPRQVGNVFYANEGPGFQLEMQNRTGKPFGGKLAWKITDFYGATTSGEKAVNVPAGTEAVNVGLDTPGLGLGWQHADLTLTDEQGRTVWQQPTSMAVLAPDTRKAGQESPYGTWWFRTLHGGTDSIAEVAPLFKRMGFRHTSPSGDQKPDGAELARNGLSLSMHPYMGGPLDQALKKLDASIAKNPTVKWAMIFHETGYGSDFGFPPEFIGKEAPKLTPRQRENFDKLMARATAYGRYIREKHPDIKIMVGNGGLPFISGLMQNGFPKDLVDAWGDEEVGQALIPEAPPTSSQGAIYWMAEYNKKYGYNVPVTTAYEWRGRGTNPGNLTELEQAQYYTRDVLRALAYHAEHINPGIIHDVGDAYYYSRWGSGGFTKRYPLLTPKISYVAMAVLTQELDQAQFQRVMDTDSPTLHALEFTSGNEWVYALWVPRGEKPVQLNFGADAASIRVTDMNGRARDVAVQARQAPVTVSDSPVYVRSKVQLTSLTSGPTSIPATPGSVVDPLKDLDNWEVVRTADKELESAHFDVPRQVGQIEVRGVNDAQKQAALELTLEPEPNLPWPIARYVTLKPRNSVPLPGKPDSVGVWVNGNSSWGRVFFEVQDARGEKFINLGAVDDGWNLADWKEKGSIDFDGWNYISAQLPARYSSGYHMPSQGDWRSTGGDGAVDFPVKLTRLVVEMRDKVVQVKRPVEVPRRSIRLAGLSVE